MFRFVSILASLKLTLAGIVLLAGASIAVYQLDHSATPWLAVPLALLALNLSAAIATNAVFRRQTALLVFHLALVTLILLAAAGRLTYLKGNAEVTEGTAFTGLAGREAGPLHGGRLAEVRFVNQGFDITYKPGPTRDATTNRVRWIDESGVERISEIGDNRPLVLHGYRFYPTFNKGYAPVLLWQPPGGAPVQGALHLPSYPVNATQQARAWRPPGAAKDIWIMLDFDETIVPADKPSRFRLPAEHRLVVRIDEGRWELRVGESLITPDGVLEYRDLRTWMGYTVFYDWTVPWLLAAGLVAVGSLGWHFWSKFAAKPWNN